MNFIDLPKLKLKEHYVGSRACVLSPLSCFRLFVTLWTVTTRPLCLWILQARILEWVAMPSFRGSSLSREETQVYLCVLHC